MRAFVTLPSAIRYRDDTSRYLYILAVQSLPILIVAAVTIGGLVVMEVGHQLGMFGAKTLTGRTTALSVIREMGPLLTGIITVAQFGAQSGSELGSMKVSEQIDALRAFGTDPVAKLVAPRLAAALIMFPPMTAICDALALVVGGIIAEYHLHIDSGIYWNSVIDLLVPGDWIIAFSKAPLFAISTTLICCYNGFAVTGGTAGVGKATIKGKKVGNVASMTLMTKNEKNGVEILIKVEEKFENLITSTAVASIKAIGILGDKYIDIKLSENVGELIPENGFLTYQREPGMTELTSSATNIMKSIETILEKINRGEGTVGKIISSEDLTKKMINIVDNMDLIISSTSKGQGLVGTLFTDNQMARDFSASINNLQSITASLKSGEGSLGSLLKDKKMVEDLTLSIEKLKKIIVSIENGEGTIGRLVKDEHLYKNINETTKSLDSLIKDLKKNPSKYINVKVF
ncbi:hypothetical protein CHS0354_024016 [Potamilus streckersoni]|uniref:ABC transporter permease n=1 Tax=Potamilus streckersoni TaxID=2493646 RepID=A0AAE0RZU3_9BIVA|nr:hypothetical protein CHS0354_024016 [Potamilus streckersoni]